MYSPVLFDPLAQVHVQDILAHADQHDLLTART
jgi:hypothetical protein